MLEGPDSCPGMSLAGCCAALRTRTARQATRLEPADGHRHVCNPPAGATASLRLAYRSDAEQSRPSDAGTQKCNGALPARALRRCYRQRSW